MAFKKDLSIDFLGVRCENPFFLSSSPVGSNYDMIAKAYKAGWGGVFYKTIGVFIPDECSPRFDITGDPGGPWAGFKNMEMISDKPLETNLDYIRRLKKDFPHKIMAVSIMGSDDEEWKLLAKLVTEAGADIIVPHMGLTTGGNIGAETALTLKDCVPLINDWAKAAKAVRSDVIVLCHGGPIATPEDAKFILENCPECNGFYGASSMERLPTEIALTETTRQFKAIRN